MIDNTTLIVSASFSANLIILETFFRKYNNLRFKNANYIVSTYASFTDILFSKYLEIANKFKILYEEKYLEQSDDDNDDDNDNVETYEDIIIEEVADKKSWFTFWNKQKHHID